MTTCQRLFAAIALTAVVATPIAAATSRVGAITVSGAWSRETASGQAVAADLRALPTVVREMIASSEPPARLPLKSSSTPCRWTAA